MKEFLKKIKRNKLLNITLLVVAGIFLLSPEVNALSVGSAINAVSHPINYSVMLVVGTLVQVIVWAVGVILTITVWALMAIAKYNNFINEEAIVNAWVIIRDFSNMFFIMILLAIAFATILRMESYSYKKLLPKLIIMAILINFSRIICGFILDIAQIIMLTFMNAIGDTGGNYINTLGVQKYLSMAYAADWTGQLNLTSTVMGLLLGMTFLIIGTVVMVVFLAMLVKRIVMIWIYVVLSPLAFMLAAFPKGESYSKQWWSDFISNVISGPVLAFFLWLSLISAGKISTITPGQQGCFGPTDILCPSSFLNFVIAIGMLVGGLVITQKVGGEAGSLAGKGLDAVRKGGDWVGKVAKSPLLGAKTLASYGIDKIYQHSGIDLNVARVWEGVSAKRKELKAKRVDIGMDKAAEVMRDRGRIYGALAMTGTSGSAWEQLTTAQGWRARLTGGKRAKRKTEDLMVDKDRAEKNLEALKEDPNYLKDKEISESLTSSDIAQKQIERTNLSNEISGLDAAIAAATQRFNNAKNLGNSVEMEKDKLEIETRNNDKESKLSQFMAVDSLLDKTAKNGYSDTDIAKAKADRKQHEDVINYVQEDIKNIEDKALKYKPIMDFEAIAARGALEAAEQKKVEHIKDREEKASMLRDAIKSGDKVRFSALALSLTHDGNENDGVLNNMGFMSNAKGLQGMIESISSKTVKDASGNTIKNNQYMGFSEQEAMALGMKISYAAEERNHWATARAFTMENGRYRNSRSDEQAMAAASEIAKMDPQGIARSLNRLGYGGETPDGKFILDDFGIALLKAIGPKIALQIDRLNPNASARLREPDNINLMIKANIAPELISALRMGGKTRTSETILATESVRRLKKTQKEPGKFYFQD